MVLSRFWLVIFISSIFFIVISLFSSNQYSIDFVLNGKKDDPVLIGETYLIKLPQSLQDTLKKVPETFVNINLNEKDVDTSYIFKNKTVQIYSGVQKSDGLLATCKNTLLDVIIPLIAYLAFFCGLMQLLIDSGASERLAKRLSPFFIKVFPTVPKIMSQFPI